MNIAIIKQEKGKYLFEVPEGIVLKQGETVKCDTVSGITDGTVWADSLNVEEPAAKLIGSLFGAKFPLKQVLGKTEYKPFEEPIPEKSMRELVNECCDIGACTASVSNGRRKANCPLKIANGACGTYAEAHPEMRQTLEAYLENERKPEEPKYYTGKVVCVNNGGYPHLWTAGKVYEVTNGKMFRDTGEAHQSKATCPEELKPNIEAVFIEFMED